MRLSLALLLSIAAIAACGDVADQPGEPTTSSTLSTTTTIQEETPSVPETTQPTADEGEAQVQAAIHDLARRLDVPEDQISVVEAEYVTWRDASLGCVEPGTGYAQVLVEGTRILLGHEGTTYHYHAESGSDPFLCRDPEDRGFVSPLKEKPEISIPPPRD